MVCISFASAELTFEKNEEVNYRFRCFDENYTYCNSAVGCHINLEYPNGTNFFDNETMEYNETYFNHSLDTSQVGDYQGIIVCEGNTIAISEFIYSITPSGKTGENILGVSILILIPMLLSFFFLIFGAVLGEDHTVLKYFLSMIGIISFWSSMHFGLLSVIRFYDWPAMQNLIGTTTYWTGWTFFLIVSYFIIYLIYTLFRTAAQEKDARLRY